MSKSKCIQIVIASIIIVITIINLPGSFIYNYKTGTGHEFYKIVQTEGLIIDEMDDITMAPYIAHSESQGIKYAIYMALGSHIPFILLIILTISLISKSIHKNTRAYLRFLFVAVWMLGMIFLANAVGYYRDIPFPQSLGSVILIYLILGVFFIAIITISNLFIRKKFTLSETK